MTLQGVEDWQGAGTHVRAIVDGLRQTDDVTLIAPQGDPPSLASRVLGIARVLVRAISESDRHDVVYLRHHPLAAPLSWWLGRCGIGRVEELNGPVEDLRTVYPALGRLWSAIIGMSRWQLRRADHVVVVSEALREYVLAFGVDPESITIVRNGADLERFQPHPYGPDLEHPYAIFVGALTEWQGLDTLVAAVDDPAWPSDLRLVVAGDGPLRHLVEDHPVIDYRGRVPHDDVPALLSRAVAALSPKTEAARWSSPLKVYEALACGTPVIATAVGEQQSLLEGHALGALVATDDATGLALAIATAYQRSGQGVTARTRSGSDCEWGWSKAVGQIRPMLYRLIRN